MKIENLYIGRGDETERLYQLEEKATAAVKKAAEELARVLKANDRPADLWKDAVPMEVAQIAEAFGYEAHRKER